MDKYSQIINSYKMTYDHHTHTVYSHGKGSIEENVKIAIEKGLKSIAITDHGPGHLTYGIKRENLSKMRKEVDELRIKYPQIEILLGVEANTIMTLPYIDIRDDERDYFDIILAGYHYGIRHGAVAANYLHQHLGLFKSAGTSLLVKNTDMILNALYYNYERGLHIDILTHPGDKGPFDIEDIAKACQDTRTLIEINDKHHHLTVDEIKLASKYDVGFVIGSDGHIPQKVGSFEGPLRRALEAGLDPERIVNIEKR